MQEHAVGRGYLKELLSQRSDVIREAMYFDLKQSMRNGGGPACLRLRVVLKENEIRAAHPGVFLDDALYTKLTDLGEETLSRPARTR